MIDYTPVRFVAHLLLISLVVTMAISLWMLRGRVIRVVHVPIGITGLVFFAAWMFLLIWSMKEGGYIPRIAIVPALAATELGAGISGWLWLALSVPYSFQLKSRKSVIADPG